MNIELTIQDMFDQYPGLFKDRADCLNHLFCVIGNGYEWKDGELVDTYDGMLDATVLKAHLVDGKAFQHNKMSLRAEAIYYAEMRLKKKHNSGQDAAFDQHDYDYFNSIPDDVYHKHPRNKRWYFYKKIPGHEGIDFCEDYAYLFNYPKNIKPDWMAAIEECRAMLVEDGFNLPR